jgi:hypothetical protein
MFTKTLITLTTLSVSITAHAYSTPDWKPEFDGMYHPDDHIFIPGDELEQDEEEGNRMVFNSVISVGTDSFYWYRNDSIGGDTFDIDSMVTNVAAPFQIQLEVAGSWDFTVHSATSIYVYTVGAGTSVLSAGTLTLGDGTHVIYNDTAAGGSELHIDLPGPPAPSGGGGGAFAPSSGIIITPGPGPGPGPSMANNPLWDEIRAEFANVEWGMDDGRLGYQFVGNNEASTLWTDLHQPGGTGDIKVSYLGDTNCSSLSLPAELVESNISVSAGHHYLMAGTSGNGPWRLDVSWGPETCAGDLNGDGRVGPADVMILMSSFGFCP